MTKPYRLAIHIFRRDLRLEDNSALIAALSMSEQVIPIFIFDPRQIEKNNYKSDHAIQFMITSLQELNNHLKNKNAKLYYFYGIAEEIIRKLITSLPIDAVFLNRDYTPFSLQRDQKIQHCCDTQKVSFHCHADILLHEPEENLKANHEPYTIFTPAYRKALQLAVNTPQKNQATNYYSFDISDENPLILSKLAKRFNPALAVKGGRKEGISLLKKIMLQQNYAEQRDYPAKNSTSKLSAHHKFGTVSIREVYKAIADEWGANHSFIKELYWRDFFTHIGFFFPQVFGLPFNEKFTSLAWSRNENHFQAWCEGRTGFPIVDAGMRELNSTGFMHNRVRMIVASFLTKDLHIDWKWGEKYFAQKLVDYDPAVNNGNWQWAASTGCDAQPYFRIFNPWLQQRKFDPACLYIKRFIPELAKYSAFDIHHIPDSGKTLISNYPPPMINHQQAAKKAKALYQKTL